LTPSTAKQTQIQWQIVSIQLENPSFQSSSLPPNTTLHLGCFFFLSRPEYQDYGVPPPSYGQEDSGQGGYGNSGRKNLLHLLTYKKRKIIENVLLKSFRLRRQLWGISRGRRRLQQGRFWVGFQALPYPLKNLCLSYHHPILKQE
jgi:hypothetical protein